MNRLDIYNVLKHLPHRYPFLLIDRVLDYTEDKSLVAIKNVTINEPFFQGHFPSRPVMPGVLVIEAMAQACGLLSFRTLNTVPGKTSVYLFVGIDKARFKKPVEPGDQLLLNVSITRSAVGVWKFAANATVEGQIVAEAELMCTVRPVEKK